MRPIRFSGVSQDRDSGMTFTDADRLLTGIREPERMIKRIDERLQIVDATLHHRVTLDVAHNVTVWDPATDHESEEQSVFSSLEPQIDKGEMRIVDPLILAVWSPFKGEPFTFEILDDSATVRQVDHDRHIAISETLIGYRLYSLWRRCEISDHERASFNEYMIELWRDLTSIPRESDRVQARAVFKRHFNEKQRRLIRFNKDFSTLTSSSMLEHNLCVLARRLATRYYVMLEVPASASGVSSISLSSVGSWSQRATSRDSSVPHWRQARATLSRAFRSGIPQAEAPSEVLVHLPWAKKTNRYTLTVDAPSGYFLAKHAVLQSRSQAPAAVWRPSGEGVVEQSWSSGNSVGRRVHVYTHGAHVEGAKLWLGMHVLEQPGRATSRAFDGALLWCLVLSATTLTVLLGADRALTAGALIFAALAVLAPFVSQAPGTSLYSLALLARLLPATALLSTVLMCLWLVLIGANDFSSWWLSRGVKFAGWVPSLGLMAVIAALLYARRTDLKNAYHTATEMRFTQNGVLYKSDGEIYNESE